MSAIKQDRPTPLALPRNLLAEVQRTGHVLGLSASEAARLALELGLPLLRTQRTAKHAPITSVAPWQPGELEADYTGETDQGYPLKEFMNAQKWGD
ncbi:MAG: hypothetical protein ACYDH9_19770 [Limisphaerales bacterium]